MEYINTYEGLITIMAYNKSSLNVTFLQHSKNEIMCFWDVVIIMINHINKEE